MLRSIIKFFLLLALVWSLPCRAETPFIYTLTLEQQRWLVQHTVIQVGINNAWRPIDFVNEQGQPDGIGVDLINLLNRRLEGRLKLVPGPWEQIYQDVVNGRIDAIMDITPKPSRMQDFNFTTPYLNIPHVIVTNTENQHVSNLRWLKGKTIALEKGFGNVEDLSMFEQVKIKQYLSTKAALLAVAKGEADAYVGNRAVVMTLIAQSRLLSSRLRLDAEVIKQGSLLTIGVRKDWPILRDILDQALSDISESEKFAILNRWAPVKQAR